MGFESQGTPEKKRSRWATALAFTAALHALSDKAEANEQNFEMNSDSYTESVEGVEGYESFEDFENTDLLAVQEIFNWGKVLRVDIPHTIDAINDVAADISDTEPDEVENIVNIGEQQIERLYKELEENKERYDALKEKISNSVQGTEGEFRQEIELYARVLDNGYELHIQKVPELIENLESALEKLKQANEAR